jgi:hypothetical protein
MAQRIRILPMVIWFTIKQANVQAGQIMFPENAATLLQIIRFVDHLLILVPTARQRSGLGEEVIANLVK